MAGAGQQRLEFEHLSQCSTASLPAAGLETALPHHLSPGPSSTTSCGAAASKPAAARQPASNQQDPALVVAQHLPSHADSQPEHEQQQQQPSGASILPAWHTCSTASQDTGVCTHHVSTACSEPPVEAPHEQQQQQQRGQKPSAGTATLLAALLRDQTALKSLKNQYLRSKSGTSAQQPCSTNSSCDMQQQLGVAQLQGDGGGEPFQSPGASGDSRQRHRSSCDSSAGDPSTPAQCGSSEQSIQPHPALESMGGRAEPTLHMDPVCSSSIPQQQLLPADAIAAPTPAAVQQQQQPQSEGDDAGPSTPVSVAEPAAPVVSVPPALSAGSSQPDASAVAAAPAAGPPSVVAAATDALVKAATAGPGDGAGAPGVESAAGAAAAAASPGSCRAAADAADAAAGGAGARKLGPLPPVAVQQLSAEHKRQLLLRMQSQMHKLGVKVDGHPLLSQVSQEQQPSQHQQQKRSQSPGSEQPNRQQLGTTGACQSTAQPNTAHSQAAAAMPPPALLPVMGRVATPSPGAPSAATGAAGAATCTEQQKQEPRLSFYTTPSPGHQQHAGSPGSLGAAPGAGGSKHQQQQQRAGQRKRAVAALFQDGAEQLQDVCAGVSASMSSSMQGPHGTAAGAAAAAAGPTAGAVVKQQQRSPMGPPPKVSMLPPRQHQHQQRSSCNPRDPRQRQQQQQNQQHAQRPSLPPPPQQQQHEWQQQPAAKRQCNSSGSNGSGGVRDSREPAQHGGTPPAAVTAHSMQRKQPQMHMQPPQLQQQQPFAPGMVGRGLPPAGLPMQGAGISGGIQSSSGFGGQQQQQGSLWQGRPAPGSSHAAAAVTTPLSSSSYGMPLGPQRTGYTPGNSNSSSRGGVGVPVPVPNTWAPGSAGDTWEGFDAAAAAAAATQAFQRGMDPYAAVAAAAAAMRAAQARSNAGSGGRSQLMNPAQQHRGAAGFPTPPRGWMHMQAHSACEGAGGAAHAAMPRQYHHSGGSYPAAADISSSSSGYAPGWGKPPAPLQRPSQQTRQYDSSSCNAAGAPTAKRRRSTAGQPQQWQQQEKPTVQDPLLLLLAAAEDEAGEDVSTRDTAASPPATAVAQRGALPADFAPKLLEVLAGIARAHTGQHKQHEQEHPPCATQQNSLGGQNSGGSTRSSPQVCAVQEAEMQPHLAPSSTTQQAHASLVGVGEGSRTDGTNYAEALAEAVSAVLADIRRFT